ncbi:MAG: PilZ domain-containing protein [Terriglobales bacterium]
MSVLTRDEDRRLHRRLACGGEARISLLPEDGALYFGALRDLSQGGVCVEMPCPLEVGSRAELLVRISGLTFRTLGQVTTRQRSRTGMEFVHLTATGRQMLQEFLADLEEMQRATAKVRMGRIESEGALSRELKTAEINPLILNSRIAPLSGSNDKSAEPPANESAKEASNEKMIHTVEAVVQVDIFG